MTDSNMSMYFSGLLHKPPMPGQEKGRKRKREHEGEREREKGAFYWKSKPYHLPLLLCMYVNMSKF